MSECCRILEIMFNYKMPMDDFREMMEDIENYQQTQQRKKIEKLCSECLKTKVVFDSETIEECSREIENFGCTFRQCPKIFLPIFRHFPWYLLARKRVYKSILKVHQKLCEILNQKVKVLHPEEDEGFQIFVILYILISLSQTVSKKPSKTNTKSHLDKQPDTIVSSQETDCLKYFDLCGIQVYQNFDYVKLCDYDVPSESYLIIYNKPE